VYVITLAQASSNFFLKGPGKRNDDRGQMPTLFNAMQSFKPNGEMEQCSTFSAISSQRDSVRFSGVLINSSWL